MLNAKAQDIITKHKAAVAESGVKLRERDFVKSIGITEAELICAYACNSEARQLKVDIADLLEKAKTFGKVLCIVRNDSAVHEMRGHFEKTFYGEGASLTLGEIDLRIINKNWAFAFEKQVEIMGKKYNSIQYFDKFGTAVFKIYEHEGTDHDAWKAFADQNSLGTPTDMISVEPFTKEAAKREGDLDIEEFRRRWSEMKDVHQLHNILKDMQVERHEANHIVGDRFAYELDKSAIKTMLDKSHEQDLPIMCFVGNRGCIQIFTGKIGPVKPYGEWTNIMDEQFHLHLLEPNVAKIWAVKKPTKDGEITSMEVFDKDNNLIIQFFGKRQEGEKELSAWSDLMASLPRLEQSAVA
ncbi:hemin-degrading factor [Bartonella sp. HY329]|uniref:hemin-degrading factor n=1 Tax=unclassified Bartonella TaxID=2645622 RepID=UPI0021C89BF3|nr:MULTISPECIES: ChuX/HutX family heme-like substrate-binding protein [unclassified Bartonella]UXM94217.1 hemin-degrading factor [Bartonella sp. HY329]UXN08539.1 hemin-degrading factor [Bartonella sp. HY328]